MLHHKNPRQASVELINLRCPPTKERRSRGALRGTASTVAHGHRIDGDPSASRELSSSAQSPAGRDTAPLPPETFCRQPRQLPAALTAILGLTCEPMAGPASANSLSGVSISPTVAESLPDYVCQATRQRIRTDLLRFCVSAPPFTASNLPRSSASSTTALLATTAVARLPKLPEPNTVRK